MVWPCPAMWRIVLCRAENVFGVEMPLPRYRPSGPAVITLFELDRVAVLAGETVVLSWRAEHATTLVVTTPDGMSVDLDARRGHGTFRISVPHTGAVTGTAHGPRGATPTVTRAVAVFELPETVDVPIPDVTGVHVPMAARTPVPAVDRSGIAAALIAAGPPVRPITVAPVERFDRRTWLAPPPGLGVITPVRPVTTSRAPRHLARLFEPPPQGGLVRRLGARLRREDHR